jgi:glycosyltransferase involved in cell wall biosynthesis
VILAKVPLYEQMVETYHCGICVRPHSVEDFKNAIEYLLTHKREAYEMGQNGRRAVLEEFSWDSQAKNVMKVITELTKE